MTKNVVSQADHAIIVLHPLSAASSSRHALRLAVHILNTDYDSNIALIITFITAVHHSINYGLTWLFFLQFCPFDIAE